MSQVMQVEAPSGRVPQLKLLDGVVIDFNVRRPAADGCASGERFWQDLVAVGPRMGVLR